MKGAVLYEYNQPLVLEDLQLDPPGRGEVKLRVAACAICHSDVHSFRGEHGSPPLPAIGGHEIAACVEEVGEGCDYVRKGDLVVASLVPTGCGYCYNCRRGKSHQCLNHHISLYAPGRYTNSKGQRLTQFAGAVAGFVEYTTVPEINVVKVPADLPIDRACLLACGVISGFGAVVNRARVKSGESVLVMGAGGVGLNAIQGAVQSGAYPIIAADVRDSKLENARRFGATHTVNVKDEKDPVKAVQDLTYGLGADYVIIAVAGLDILRQGFLMSAADGMTVVVGHGHDERLSAFNPVEFMRGKRLTGSAMGATEPRRDIPRLIELYRAGRLKLDELVSGHYPFDKINEAVADMEKGEAIRNVIMFD